jgi:phage tail sheath protein FI
VATANVPLQGVLALDPPMAPTDLVNTLARQPRGFLPTGADTLSLDPDLGRINVRRLLILLRRLALRHGATYVFEPYGDALRRRVQHGFEALLDLLLARGALAGPTAASSYQVRVSAQTGLEGRLVVELAVAPALPMRFLTIRLVQTDQHTLAAVEVP